MITVENLSFSYTKSPFISGMSFSVPEGEIFGFLGPSRRQKHIAENLDWNVENISRLLSGTWH